MKKEIEYNSLQKDYLNYYNFKAKKSRLTLYLFTVFFILSLIAIVYNIITQKPEFIPEILLLVLSGLVIIYWYSRYQKKYLLFVLLTLFIITLSSIIINYDNSLICIDNILIAYGLFLEITLLIYSRGESKSKKYAKSVLPYILPHKTINHTAVILPHDKNKINDGGDTPVVKLLEGLKKYGEECQVYFCTKSDELESILTNPDVKRIWIFGHGDRGGVCLTDKFFIYSEFMTEKTDNGWKIRNIQPKEYVYQCHCNPKSTTPLTDYLIKEKGMLNSEIDDMPNYHDSGIVDMDLPSSWRNLFSIRRKLYKKISWIFHKDMNYMNPNTIEYLIERYLNHLKNNEQHDIGNQKLV